MPPISDEWELPRLRSSFQLHEDAVRDEGKCFIDFICDSHMLNIPIRSRRVLRRQILPLQPTRRTPSVRGHKQEACRRRPHGANHRQGPEPLQSHPNDQRCRLRRQQLHVLLVQGFRHGRSLAVCGRQRCQDQGVRYQERKARQDAGRSRRRHQRSCDLSSVSYYHSLCFRRHDY